MRRMTTKMNWNWPSSHIDCMYHNLPNVGVELKVTFLHMLTLALRCEVLPPSQNDCPIYLPGQKLKVQSHISLRQTFIIKKYFDTATSRGVLEFCFVLVFILFLFLKSHTYNYSVNDQYALISPKLTTLTIILGRRGVNDVSTTTSMDYGTSTSPYYVSKVDNLHYYLPYRILPISFVARTTHTS